MCVHTRACVCVCVCVFSRRKWQFLPGESHGQRSLASYSLWGCIELDMAEETENICVCVHIHYMLFYSYAKSSSHNSGSVTTEYLLHTTLCETCVQLCISWVMAGTLLNILIIVQ